MHYFDLKNVDLESIAGWTDGFTGADLAEICRRVNEPNHND